MRFLSNIGAFIGLWLVFVALHGYVFQFEHDGTIMAYGYLTIRFCDFVANQIFPINYRRVKR